MGLTAFDVVMVAFCAKVVEAWQTAKPDVCKFLGGDPSIPVLIKFFEYDLDYVVGLLLMLYVVL